MDKRLNLPKLGTAPLTMPSTAAKPPAPAPTPAPAAKAAPERLVESLELSAPMPTTAAPTGPADTPWESQLSLHNLKEGLSPATKDRLDQMAESGKLDAWKKETGTSLKDHFFSLKLMSPDRSRFQSMVKILAEQRALHNVKIPKGKDLCPEADILGSVERRIADRMGDDIAAGPPHVTYLPGPEAEGSMPLELSEANKAGVDDHYDRKLAKATTDEERAAIERERKDTYVLVALRESQQPNYNYRTDTTKETTYDEAGVAQTGVTTNGAHYRDVRQMNEAAGRVFHDPNKDKGGIGQTLADNPGEEVATVVELTDPETGKTYLHAATVSQSAEQAERGVATVYLPEAREVSIEDLEEHIPDRISPTSQVGNDEGGWGGWGEEY